MSANTPDLAATALGAPNLWGQVYLACRWLHALPHDDSMALADDAVRAFDDEPCATLEDLNFTVREIARND
ncbi:hypothetical protein [Bordetella genomosp. 1]|uniref:Uncharacterized protein n=1 Tax=Bordetella genomosp. 1 TaxID=1395607 RepID=A0ABX4EW99_9BORD|nr:hypothetical protein [Bordetella genomosp. 1]OZI58739.1 hypothetical protein CAL27_18840 [Bordetella genomosp. 1]